MITACTGHPGGAASPILVIAATSTLNVCVWSQRPVADDADRGNRRVYPEDMDKIAVIYATWHGQAREVAQHVANVAAARGLAVDIHEVRDAPSNLNAYAGVAIVGSIHFGRHSLALSRFTRRHREWLTANPSAFFSISGAAISMDGRRTAQTQIDNFLRNTGWQPDLSISLAGATPFTKYDPITRWAMKYASRFAGRPADTSRDYDFTNWFDVDEGTQALINAIERHTRISAERRRATG